MKAYIGVKIVHAEPLNLGAYNIRRGWAIPANENPARPGYYLKYPDGYESWSPKEIFEAAYRVVSIGEAELILRDGGLEKPRTFLDRLKAECAELTDRYLKLQAFIPTPAFLALDDEQQKLLREQARHMVQYQQILVARLALLDAPLDLGEFPQIGEVKTTGGGSVETPVPFK